MSPWSFSSLTKYETCPRQYHIVKVAKLVKEPPTVHTDWGNYVHKALELRVKEGTPLPADIAKYEPMVAKIATLPGQVNAEQQYALTRNLQPTGFFAEDCWHRGIIDISVLANKKAFLGDYKTGKVEDDFEQLTLSSAAFMQAHPQVESVSAAYIWLAHNKVTRKNIDRDQIPVIWEGFIGRVKRLEYAFDKDRWLPKPSGLCAGWCPVGREHCEFWRPKK